MNTRFFLSALVLVSQAAIADVIGQGCSSTPDLDGNRERAVQDASYECGSSVKRTSAWNDWFTPGNGNICYPNDLNCVQVDPVYCSAAYFRCR